MSLPAAITVSVSGAALVIGAAFSGLAARRAAYERVMKALDAVSDGTVAKARHELGTLVYEFPDSLAAGQLILTGAAEREIRSKRIEDLFTILWAARRVEATRRSLGHRWAASGPHVLLHDSLAKWVQWWIEADQHDRMRIEAVANSLGATVSRADDLDGLITLRDKWKLPSRQVA